MVGNIPELTDLVTVTSTSAATVVPGQILYIPLQFWFCRNPGLALPLIALQYHEVKINLEFEDLNNLFWSGKKATSTSSWALDRTVVTVPGIGAASLYVDYVYLDTEERRRFAQVSHEYLIEQLQFTGDESVSNENNKIKLNFNHPVKELIWVVQPDDHIADDALLGKQWFNFTDAFDETVLGAGFNSEYATAVAGVAPGGASKIRLDAFYGKGENPVARAKLLLNGHERFSERDGRYFNLVQPYQHHENVPSKGINVYSFGLKPEEHQPSGTCNMSRIDNATLQLTLTPATVKTRNTTSPYALTNNSRTARVKVFAVNYNVLRIMSGMGGLAYAN